MEPVSSTSVSPALAFGAGVVVGVTATAVVITYKKEIRAAALSTTEKAKSLFGKKVEAPAVEAQAVEAPAVEAQAVEAPVVEAPKVEEPKVEAPVVEAPKVEEPKVEAPVMEAAAKLAELLSPVSPVATVSKEVVVVRDDIAKALVSASVNESDVVLLTKEVAAGLAEAMTQLPNQQVHYHRQQKKPHLRR